MRDITLALCKATGRLTHGVRCAVPGGSSLGSAADPRQVMAQQGRRNFRNDMDAAEWK